LVNHLFTAVPLTTILAISVFGFYVVLLKYIVRPWEKSRWKDLKEKPFWKQKELFMWSLCFLLALIFIGVFFIVFIASLWNPDMLNHGLFYDIFLFRTNNNSQAGAHAIDYLLIPGFFFFCIFYWGKGEIVDFISMEKPDSLIARELIFKAALMSAFMVFFHESIWFFFYYIKYWRVELDSLSDVVIGDLTFLVMIGTFLLATRLRYREEFSRYLLYGALIYTADIFIWFLVGLKVTTIPVVVNGIPNATITQYYLDPLTNFLEVQSWILVFFIMLAVVILNHKRLIQGQRSSKVNATKIP